MCVRARVFVCHENPSDAVRWVSETMLKGVILHVFREIAHSSLIMYFSHRQPGKLTQTASNKLASCSHKGTTENRAEGHINTIRMQRIQKSIEHDGLLGFNDGYKLNLNVNLQYS